MTEPVPNRPHSARRRIVVVGVACMLLVVAGLLALRSATWTESFAGVGDRPRHATCEGYMLGITLDLDQMPSQPEGVLDLVRANVPSFPSGPYESTMMGDRGELRHRDSDGRVDAVVRVHRVDDSRWTVDGVEGCSSSS